MERALAFGVRERERDRERERERERLNEELIVKVEDEELHWTKA